jgi:hypothetical protein
LQQDRRSAVGTRPQFALRADSYIKTLFDTTTLATKSTALADRVTYVTAAGAPCEVASRPTDSPLSCRLRVPLSTEMPGPTKEYLARLKALEKSAFAVSR